MDLQPTGAKKWYDSVHFMETLKIPHQTVPYCSMEMRHYYALVTDLFWALENKSTCQTKGTPYSCLKAPLEAFMPRQDIKPAFFFGTPWNINKRNCSNGKGKGKVDFDFNVDLSKISYHICLIFSMSSCLFFSFLVNASLIFFSFLFKLSKTCI